MNPYRPKLPATYERRARVTDQARAHQALAALGVRLVLALMVGGFAALMVHSAVAHVSAAFGAALVH